MEDKKEKIPTPWELFHIECGKGWESLYKPIFEYIENATIKLCIIFFIAYLPFIVYFILMLIP